MVNSDQMTPNIVFRMILFANFIAGITFHSFCGLLCAQQYMKRLREYLNSQSMTTEHR